MHVNTILSIVWLQMKHRIEAKPLIEHLLAGFSEGKMREDQADLSPTGGLAVIGFQVETHDQAGGLKPGPALGGPHPTLDHPINW